MTDISEARRIRTLRGEVLKGLESQSLWVEEVLRDPPEAIPGCPIGKLLKATRHLGETKVRTILNLTSIDFEAKVCNLSPEQIEAIITNLPKATRRTAA